MKKLKANLLWEVLTSSYPKLSLTMKLTIVVLFATTMTLLAGNSYSQATMLNLNIEDASVKEILLNIEGQSEFFFMYNSKLIDVDRRVSLNIKEKKIDEVLNSLFSGTNVKYVTNDRIIILSPEQHDNKSEFQQHTIKGKVTDTQGNPLPGVNIVEKGTMNGTITNLDGEYALSVNSSDAVLTFSYIGFLTENFEVGGQTIINLTMIEDITSFEEIVVIGYGSMKKSDLTGSVSRANIEDFKKSPNTNLIQSLQGTVPGLNIGQVTSAGKTPEISIRGKNTISGNTDVLIILDGIPYNSSLSSINPDDIESVDVLKDASSTAVYGAQAANGVILITTKKGKIGEKPQISFSTSYTTQTPTVDLRPMNRQEYIDHVRDLHWEDAYDLSDGTLNPDYNVIDDFQEIFRDEDGNLLSNDYDWWDAGTDPGFINKYQLSVTGGSKTVSYLISGGLTNQKGFIINDKFKRKNLRINLESQTTPWLKLGVQSFGSFVNKDGAEPSIYRLMRQSPLLTPYDENGDIIPYPFNTLDENPFMFSDIDDYERNNYFFANLYAEVDIPFIKGLTYRLNYGNNYRLEDHNQASIFAAGEEGEAYKKHKDYYSYTVDNILTFKRDINKNNSITATLVYGAEERQYSYTEAKAEDFSRLNLGYNSIEVGTNQYTYSDAWEEALNYQMARLNYKFKNKYLLTATIRRDGFSGFAENEKYALFPSVALGWVVTEDISLPHWISYLKIRGGYGVSGNQTKHYKSLAKIETHKAYVFGDEGYTLIGQELSSLGNSGLRWEKTKGLSLGIDFSMLQNRISGNIDYYNNITDDLLYDIALPRLSGFDKISTNIGKLKNTGVEVALTSRNLMNGDFKWSTTLTFSTNSNKIVEITGVDADGDGKEDDLVASNLFIDQPLDAIYGYEVDGIYQLDDEKPEGYYTGTYRIVDQDGGEYEITTDDRKILGHKEPAYRAGLLNKFEYKRFSLSIFLNTIQGGKDGYLGENSRAISRGSNTLIWNYISDIDYWSPGNPDGEYPRSVTTPAITPKVYYNRSFVRLQDIILSYSIPENILNKIKVERLDIYVSGKNLATWTSWKGWDPETGSGLTTGGRPVMKGYSIGCNITF